MHQWKDISRAPWIPSSIKELLSWSPTHCPVNSLKITYTWKPPVAQLAAKNLCLMPQTISRDQTPDIERAVIMPYVGKYVSQTPGTIIGQLL